MAVSDSTDRFNGVVAHRAIKVPCVVATIADITLSGNQTIDSVAVVTDDRVLVVAQTNAVENGIYNVRDSAWERAADWDGNRDIGHGTLAGAYDSLGTFSLYEVTTVDPIFIDTTAVTIAGWFDPAADLLPDGTVTNAALKWDGAAWIEAPLVTFIENASGTIIRADTAAGDQARVQLLEEGGSSLSQVIHDPVTGEMQFIIDGSPTTEFAFYNGSLNTALRLDPAGSQILYHNNVAKLTTVVGGVLLDDSMYFLEKAAANADILTQGQLWVRDDDPNVLIFTDDLGTDFILGAGIPAGTVTGSGLIWDGAAWLEGQALTTEVLSFDWITGNDADILITSEEDKVVLTLHADSLGTGIGQTRNPRIHFLRDTGGTQGTANIGIASTVNDDDAAGASFIDSTAGALAIHSATTGSRVQIGAAGRAKFSVGVNDVKFQYGTDPTTRYSQWQFTGAAGEELHITHANMEDWKIQDLTGSIFMDNSLKLQDQSAADASDAGYGQLWVRDDAPDTLMFTDDDGNDFAIGGSLAPSGFAIDHYDYDYDIATGQADPGPGLFRLNNTTPSSATFMYIDLVDANGVNLDLDVLATIAIGWTLRLVDPTDFATLVRYSITQAVDFSTYWRISIDNIDGGATSLTDTNAIKVIFDPTPNVELGSETSSQSDMLYWEGSTGKWEATGSFLTVNPAIPSIGGHIHLGGQGTVDATRCGIFQETANSISTLWFSEGSGANEGFFCQHIGSAGVEQMLWGWDTPGGGQENIFGINEAGDFLVFGDTKAAIHLDILADINTGTPPTTEAVTTQIRFLDLAGNDVLGRIGYEGDNDLKLRNFMHDGDVIFLAEDSAGLSRTFLHYDPQGEFLLAADANMRLQVNVSEDAILATANAGVGLYFNGLIAMTTTANGILLPQVDDAAAPTLAFGDGDTGIYEASNDTLIIATGGIARYRIASTNFESFNTAGPTMRNQAASSTTAVFAPDQGDSDTGMGQNAEDQLSLIAGGLEAVRLSEASSHVLVKHETEVGMTAFATGGITSATRITSSYSVFSTVATLADSCKLPITFPVGQQVIIKNDGAADMDVFPSEGDDIGAGTNTAVSVVAGTSAMFVATAVSATWTQIY